MTLLRAFLWRILVALFTVAGFVIVLMERLGRGANLPRDPARKSKDGKMKYRKKPVVIEAVHFPTDCFNETDLRAMVRATCDFEEVLAEFAPDDFRSWKWRGGKAPGIVIPTLEGEHLASPGDWIIKGVKGEFYPCKPDIFAATYEPAE